MRSTGATPSAARSPISAGCACSVTIAASGNASFVIWVPNWEIVSAVQSRMKFA
jgi:hypothetical protein